MLGYMWGTFLNYGFLRVYPKSGISGSYGSFIQGEVSKKEENRYRILTCICGI